MVFTFRHCVEFAILFVTVAIQLVFGYWVLDEPRVRSSRRWRSLVFASVLLLCGWMCAGVLLDSGRVARHFPRDWASWISGGATCWALFSLVLFPGWLLARSLPKPDAVRHPARRRFLRAVWAALAAAPAAAIGYGVFVQRTRFRLREVDLDIPDLPRDLDGLRLVQLSDIHLSAFLSEKELAWNVDMANETGAHIALVTGDLISGHSDPIDACLNQLARLRTGAGTLGCLGNHEIYAGVSNYATREGARRGIRFLRREFAPLQIGRATVRFTGVDYQRMGEPYLVGAERFVDPAAFNILLSHNPDVFPVAARQGYQLTISGHTHGGQVDIEILRHDLSVARFFTPYVYGVYRRGRSTIYVTRGIGTVGLPARLGAPPEVALLRLCAT